MLNILFLKKIREFFYIEGEINILNFRKDLKKTANIYIAGKESCNMTVRY